VIVERDRGQLNGKVFTAAALAWLALGAALFATNPSARSDVAIGWGLAGVLSALSFAALIWVRQRSWQDLMMVVVGGFLARMLVLGVTLVLVLRAHGDPLRFALGFFSAYLLLQLIEVIWLNSVARQARQHREVSA
jgi:hypothetical protein